MTLDDANLYEMLFPDCDDHTDDIGRIRINEIFSNSNIDEISKYYDMNTYNNTISASDSSTLNLMHFNIRNLLINKDELEAV